MTLDVILQSAAGNSGMTSLIMIAAMVAIMYFFMIRPQQKKQKEIAKFRASMNVGDKVITAGGIHGKIKEIKDDAVIIEIAENVRIKIDKGSIFANAADSQQQAK